MLKLHVCEFKQGCPLMSQTFPTQKLETCKKGLSVTTFVEGVFSLIPFRIRFLCTGAITLTLAERTLNPCENAFFDKAQKRLQPTTEHGAY